MKYFTFCDMHSGGYTKVEPYAAIILQATDDMHADQRFQVRFGHNPHDRACECCGENYFMGSPPEGESLRRAIKYATDWSDCRWGAPVLVVLSDDLEIEVRRIVQEDR